MGSRVVAKVAKTFGVSTNNFSTDWNIPVAPEVYTRSGKLFGDQYSNFNAGKLLLYLEGLAGLEYSIPDNTLVVHDTMPTNWKKHPTTRTTADTLSMTHNRRLT